jgi:hypothetical protein
MEALSKDTSFVLPTEKRELASGKGEGFSSGNLTLEVASSVTTSVRFFTGQVSLICMPKTVPLG